MGFQQGFRINTNTAALDTYRSYSASQAGMERNIERLSSGSRINKAADDAAGLAISERMDHQVQGMRQAHRNVLQANNLLQTAEGGMSEIGNILGRMRELAVQASSDTVSDTDRDSLNLEFGELEEEITRIAETTQYDNMALLDGTFSSKKVQVSADHSSSAGITNLDISLGNFKVASANTDFAGANSISGSTAVSFANGANIGLDVYKLDLDTVARSQTTIDSIDLMVEALNTARSKVGAQQNRLEFTASSLMNGIQNNASSMSTIRDADFAAEAADLARNQILTQSGSAMLAQANGLTANVLQLIR
jgi:flagellin